MERCWHRGEVHRERKAGLVDDFGLLSSWGNEEDKRDCCRWERVRCSNQTGHVQMLREEYDSEVYHDRPHLTGKISTSLMELQHLRYLNLSFNDFEYSHIPEFLGSLYNLRYLDVSQSFFVGKIPRQLGSLLNLQHLDLSGNRLEGVIPSQLGNLSQLQYLDLSHIPLEGVIPSQLGNLSQLQYLDLYRNYLEGVIPSQLANLSRLHKLYLGYNQALKIHNKNLEDAQWLSNLTSLVVLDFSFVLNLNHSRYFLHIIGKLQNLRELYLTGCDLPADDLFYLNPSQFNFSSSLTILDLSWVPNLNNSHYFLHIIGKLQNLRELYLAGCDLLDHDLLFLNPSKFNFHSSLTFLDLYHNNISANSLKSMANICTLSTLILSDVSLSVGFSTILHSLSGCVSYTLQELDLRLNQITGSLSNLSKFSSLKSLYLLGNDLSGIAEGEIQNTCSLNSLDISYNKLNVDISSMTHYLFGCRSTLQESNLRGNQITGVLLDLSKFPSMKELDLNRNQLNGMHNNFRLPPQLKFLNVSFNFMEGGIPESFGKTCSLHYLYLFNNSLSNELPVIIHNLFGCARSLQVLDLSSNQVNGTVSDLSKFSSLITLSLHENQLNGEIPNDIIFPSQLVDLDIFGNPKLKGVITDSHFTNMSKLKSLSLSFTSLTFTFSTNWVPPFQLESISLASCKLT